MSQPTRISAAEAVSYAAAWMEYTTNSAHTETLRQLLARATFFSYRYIDAENATVLHFYPGIKNSTSSSPELVMLCLPNTYDTSTALPHYQVQECALQYKELFDCPAPPKPGEVAETDPIPSREAKKRRCNWANSELRNNWVTEYTRPKATMFSAILLPVAQGEFPTNSWLKADLGLKADPVVNGHCIDLVLYLDAYYDTVQLIPPFGNGIKSADDFALYHAAAAVFHNQPGTTTGQVQQAVLA